MLDRKLLVVTGKGGTGKTSVAAALAKVAAASGQRVLLAEIDVTGDISSAFDGQPISFEPRQVEPNLYLMHMDTEAALSEYLKLNLKLPVAIRLGPFAKAFDFVATAAPGVREVLTIGKLCWEVKRENYDLVIADAPASGHVIGQLQSPEAIGGLVSSGPLDRQTAWMKEMLTDPQRTGVVVVTAPEEVPISETIELLGRLKSEANTPIAGVVVNRILPELFLKEDEATFAALGQLSEVPGNIAGVLEVARLGAALRKTQVRHLDDLFASVDQSIPLIFLPQSFESLSTHIVVKEMAEELASELS